ncbi:MAG: hypothetical protein Q4G33_03530 [bacterium]|nr:hypothetical protein [bacterium]
MKKIFETPSLSIKNFNKENIITLSGSSDTPALTAEEKAAAALGNEVSIIRLSI